MQTTKLSDLVFNEETAWRILIYGNANCGKTTFAGTFPKPMFFFDFDNKLKPLYGVEGIEFVSYSFKDRKDGYLEWRRFWKDFKEIKTDTRYKTIVFDSLTSMDDCALLNCIVLAGFSAEDPPHIWKKFSLPIYLELADTYRFLFLEMNKIPGKNVILTAHKQEIFEKGEDNILEIVPFFTGRAVKPKLPQVFEEVYYLERKGGNKDERVLHVRPYKKAIAGSLVLNCQEIINPTYDKLVAERDKK